MSSGGEGTRGSPERVLVNAWVRKDTTEKTCLDIAADVAGTDEVAFAHGVLEVFVAHYAGKPCAEPAAFSRMETYGTICMYL